VTWPRRTWRPGRKSKMGNVSCRCFSGHCHDSRAEARYCDQLRAAQQAGDIVGYVTQVNTPLIVCGKVICHHIVDFVVEVRPGEFEAREVKGFATPEWSIKHKLWLATNPMPYVVIRV